MTQDTINRIAFINLQGQVVTTDPQGRAARPVTGVGRIFQFPAWAPDGSKLAAIGSDRLGSGVFVMPDAAEPAELQALYYNRVQEPVYLYWSPDSRQVSFIATHPHEGLGLHLASLEEQASHLLTTGRPCFWDWTPGAGQLLVHIDISSLGARVAFMNPLGEDQETILTQPGAFQAPGVARNGRYWAYAGIDDLDNSRLVITGPAGTEPFTLPHQGVLALGWDPTPTGRLAFISSALPAQQFYGPLQVVDMATRSVQTLVEDTLLAFFWSPNGQYLAYLTLNHLVQEDDMDHSLNRTNGVYGSKPKTEPAPTQQNTLSSSLSLKLGLVELATGLYRSLFSFTPVPLFINQFLPFFDQYALSHRLWSPASDALVLPVMEGDKPRIMVLPVDGAPPHPIGEGVMAFWSWQ